MGQLTANVLHNNLGSMSMSNHAAKPLCPMKELLTLVQHAILYYHLPASKIFKWQQT